MIESIPPRLLTDYDAQGCVVTTAQALDAGMDPRDVRRLVTTQQWVRLRRGAYTTRATYDGADEVGRHLLDARAAHLTLRAGRVFSHVTAAVIHGLPVHRLPLGEVHVTHVDGEGSGRHESGVWHHVGAVQEQDRVVRSGLPVLDLARTAFDVGRVAPTEGALVVADAVLRAGGTPSQLRDQLEAGRDWPGSRRAARPLLLADARAESPGESIARLAFHDIDLPPDELQWRLTTDAGVFRSDFAWTTWRVVGEFDGKVKYGRLLRPGEDPSDVVWRERQRELAIERLGWIVVRFTWAEVHDLALVRRRLLAAVARSRALGLCA
jgi:very-short-patch-repair endonuclease